jgi:hypothetical protein
MPILLLLLLLVRNFGILLLSPFWHRARPFAAATVHYAANDKKHESSNPNDDSISVAAGYKCSTNIWWQV